MLEAEYSGGLQDPFQLRTRLLLQVQQHLTLPSLGHEEHLVDMFLSYMSTLAAHEKVHGSASVEVLRYRVRESLQRYVHYLDYDAAVDTAVSDGVLIATAIPAMAIVADEGDMGDPGLQLGSSAMFDPLLDDLAEAEVTMSSQQQNSFQNTATAMFMDEDLDSSALPPLPLGFEADPAVEESNVVHHCVSLQFLLHFIDKHRIEPHTTTAEVAETIIKAHTAVNGKSYVDTHLVSSFPSYVVNAKDHVMQQRKSPRAATSNQHAHITYVNHCHDMSFHHLVHLLKLAATKQYASPFLQGNHAHLEHDDFQLDAYLGQEVFFWIDIFCHSQHENSINIQYINDCIATIGHMTLALAPGPHPLTFERIWCLYEVSSAHLNDCRLYLVDDHNDFYDSLLQAVNELPEFHDSLSEEENVAMWKRAMASKCPVDVQHAKASRQEDFHKLTHALEAR